MAAGDMSGREAIVKTKVIWQEGQLLLNFNITKLARQMLVSSTTKTAEINGTTHLLGKRCQNQVKHRTETINT